MASKKCEFLKPKKSLEKNLKHPQVIAWRSLMRSCFFIYRFLEKALLKENCSIPRFQILFYLYFEGPHSAIDLSRKLFVTRGNISMFVRRLLREEIIEVSPETISEKRPLFCLTTRGRIDFEEIFPRHIDRVVSIMPSLPSKFLKILDQISQKK